jgi:hypothetical protein
MVAHAWWLTDHVLSRLRFLCETHSIAAPSPGLPSIKEAGRLLAPAEHHRKQVEVRGPHQLLLLARPQLQHVLFQDKRPQRGRAESNWRRLKGGGCKDEVGDGDKWLQRFVVWPNHPGEGAISTLTPMTHSHFRHR